MKVPTSRDNASRAGTDPLEETWYETYRASNNPGGPGVRHTGTGSQTDRHIEQGRIQWMGPGRCETVKQNKDRSWGGGPGVRHIKQG